MREIKFRAKRSDDGAWVYGDLTHIQKICSVEEKNKTGKSTISVIRIAGYDVDEETIGQLVVRYKHIGEEPLEIYTDDVLDIWDTEDEEMLHCLSIVDEHGIVSWKQERWFTIDNLDYYGFNFKVMGNIYDNSDLKDKAV